MVDNSPIKAVKVVKGDRTYTNFYLFGVCVVPNNKNDFTKLYYSAKEYFREHNIEVPTITKVADESKEEKKSK